MKSFLSVDAIRRLQLADIPRDLGDLSRRQRGLRRHVRRLRYLTIAWNSAEFVVAVAAGLLAGSVALIGFGFDSAIEVSASGAALWRLRHDADEARREAAEQRALRLIGACFLVLAAYVLYEAAEILLERRAPGGLSDGGRDGTSSA